MKIDILVIGSGPVGACCARALAEQGLTVRLLEAGNAISDPPGSHLRNQQAYQENPDDFFAEIKTWCHMYSSSAAPSELPGANVTRAYGGQGVVWTNNCPRPPSHEMVPGYTPEEWNDLYSVAEQYLGVSDHLFDDSHRQHRLFEVLPPVLAQQGRSLSKVPLSASRTDTGGTHFNATRDILDLQPEVLDRITVECGKRVSRLELAADRVTGVELVAEDGSLQRYQSDAVVVAGGAFDTTQLLYDSGIRPAALGHYLQFHPLIMGQLILDEDLCGPQGDSPPRCCVYPSPDHPWHSMILRDIFPAVDAVRPEERRLLDMQFFVPIEVRQSNRMILSDGPPRFDVRLSQDDERRIESARADLLELAGHLGRFRPGGEPMLLDFGFTHPMGMCRLGENPDTSVADCQGRVHGFRNLYLATVGLIPNTMAVNPTLTAAALAVASARSIVNSPVT